MVIQGWEDKFIVYKGCPKNGVILQQDHFLQQDHWNIYYIYYIFFSCEQFIISGYRRYSLWSFGVPGTTTLENSLYLRCIQPIIHWIFWTFRMSDSWDVERDEVIIFVDPFSKRKHATSEFSPKVKASHPKKNQKGNLNNFLRSLPLPKRSGPGKQISGGAKMMISLMKIYQWSPLRPYCNASVLGCCNSFRVIRKATVERWTNGWAFIERNLFWDA